MPTTTGPIDRLHLLIEPRNIRQGRGSPQCAVRTWAWSWSCSSRSYLFLFRRLAHSPPHRVPYLGASFRPHTLFQRVHDVDDFRCLVLSRNLDLRRTLLDLGAKQLMQGFGIFVGQLSGSKRPL